MLILTRRIGESIMIGDEVTVTVLRIKGNQVRVGVDAPRNIVVQREELVRSEEPSQRDPVAVIGASPRR